jgi:hypothetical protein
VKRREILRPMNRPLDDGGGFCDVLWSEGDRAVTES